MRIYNRVLFFALALMASGVTLVAQNKPATLAGMSISPNIMESGKPTAFILRAAKVNILPDCLAQNKSYILNLHRPTLGFKPTSSITFLNKEKTLATFIAAVAVGEEGVYGAWVCKAQLDPASTPDITFTVISEDLAISLAHRTESINPKDLATMKETVDRLSKVVDAVSQGLREQRAHQKDNELTIVTALGARISVLEDRPIGISKDDLTKSIESVRGEVADVGKRADLVGQVAGQALTIAQNTQAGLAETNGQLGNLAAQTCALARTNVQAGKSYFLFYKGKVRQLNQKVGDETCRISAEALAASGKVPTATEPK